MSPPDEELLEDEELLDELLEELLLEDELLEDDEELSADFTNMPLKVPLSACVDTVMVSLPSFTVALNGGRE